MFVKIIRLILSIIIFVPFAYIQAEHLHQEYKFWYLYIILPAIPWIDIIYKNKSDILPSLINVNWKKVVILLVLLFSVVFRTKGTLFMGAIIIGLIIFFTSFKIKSWQKWAVAGVLYGIFSFFSMWGIGWSRYPTLGEKIVFLPMGLSVIIHDINPKLFDIVPFIGPIIFGALFGVGIGKLLGKLKSES